MNSNKKVLVICSNADLSDLYQEILWKCGIPHVEIAESIQGSVARVDEETYDLIVLDCKSPNGNIEDLKNAVDPEKILCIASKIEEKKDISIPFLIKPFRVDEFVKQVTNVRSR